MAAYLMSSKPPWMQSSRGLGRAEGGPASDGVAVFDGRVRDELQAVVGVEFHGLGRALGTCREGCRAYGELLDPRADDVTVVRRGHRGPAVR